MNYFITPTIYTVTKGNLKIEKKVNEYGYNLRISKKENDTWSFLGIVELIHEGMIGSLPECEKIFVPEVELNLESCDKDLFPHLEDIVNILNSYLSTLDLKTEKEEVILDVNGDRII